MTICWDERLEYSPTLGWCQGILLLYEAGSSHNSLAWGLSIETAGYTFYIFATNNTRLQSSSVTWWGHPTTRPLTTGACAVGLRAFCEQAPTLISRPFDMPAMNCKNSKLRNVNERIMNRETTATHQVRLRDGRPTRTIGPESPQEQGAVGTRSHFGLLPDLYRRTANAA